jgi:Tfp pilus assembly protein PilO
MAIPAPDVAPIAMIQDVPVPQIPEIPPIPEVVIHNASFWSGLPPVVVMMITVAVIAAGVVVLLPIVRSIARAIDARTDRRFGVPVEVERLQERVAELEALQPRLAELEERLDFAERLLTRPSAAEPLRSGDA